jgi:hypothetical protein
MSVAGADGAYVPLSTASAADTDMALLNEMNRIAQAFAVAKFRGSVNFQIATSAGDLCWTCNVTFTDDIPGGVWNNINHHFQGQ